MLWFVVFVCVRLTWVGLVRFGVVCVSCVVVLFVCVACVVVVACSLCCGFI